jgi:hypothetical protein
LLNQRDGELAAQKARKNLLFQKEREADKADKGKSKKQKKTKGKEKAFKADFGQRQRGRQKGKIKRGRIQKRR